MTANPYLLDGCDMRGPQGRRYRDIVDITNAEFGAAGPEAVREMSLLKFNREEIHASIVNGTGSLRAHADLVRISNLIARREKVLGDIVRAKTAKTTVSPSLADFLSRDGDAE